MKKYISLLLVFVLAISLFTACSETESHKVNPGMTRTAGKKTISPTDDVTPTPTDEQGPTPIVTEIVDPTNTPTPIKKPEAICDHKFSDGACRECGTTWIEWFLGVLQELNNSTYEYQFLTAETNPYFLNQSDTIDYFALKTEVAICYTIWLTNETYFTWELVFYDLDDRDEVEFTYYFEDVLAPGKYEEDPEYMGYVEFFIERSEFFDTVRDKCALEDALTDYVYLIDGETIDVYTPQVEIDAIKNSTGAEIYSMEELISMVTSNQTSIIKAIQYDLEKYGTSLEEAGLE